MLWSYPMILSYPMSLWSCDPMMHDPILWFYDRMIPPTNTYDPMILGSYDPILWSYDPMILWPCDPMILWSYDPMILGWCVATRKPYNTKTPKLNQCQQPMKPNPNTSYNVNPCVTNLHDIANPNTTYNSNHKNLQCLAFVLLKWHVYTVGLF